MKQEKSMLAISQEIYRKIEAEEYSAIDEVKNPFVLLNVSKMIHGKNN